MKFSFVRIFLMLLASPLSVFASNTVVNLSHYDQMRVDFNAMTNAGIVGVIHEATYPRNVVDDKYAARQGAAVRAGLLWGAYHFANASDPVRQADFFLSTVERTWRRSGPESRPNEILLVLDFEKNGHYPGGTMRIDQAVAFVERIRERTGVYPGLYSNENRISGVVNNPAVSSAHKRALARCWLWIANYHYPPRQVAPWGHWTMWQYTGDGVCDLPRSTYPKNIANIKNAERNMFRGSPDAARAFWQAHSWRPGQEEKAAPIAPRQPFNR
ncbi:MAG TPA: glycoside hydrolase family 25 protein [Chthoniobacterales bacterium]|nr:glycoside hydrolase family 25 protein [Chthoniobacterales bacterium]